MTLLDGKYSDYSILIIAVAALFIPLIFIESTIIEHTHEVFSYPLDDPYIHMAIAKNLALYNTWGIFPHEFASASSSILYPLLLAAVFKITGINSAIPFILNCLAGIVFLVVVQKWMRKQGIGHIESLLILLLSIFLIPLPLIIMCGMEHTLQLLFCFLFITSFAERLQICTTNPSNSSVLPWTVYLYSCLMVATRYESLSILAITCAILLYYRQWTSAILLSMLGFLPILLFGLYSLHKGSDFFPNSVLLKSGVPPLTIEGLSNYFSDEFARRFFYTEAGPNMVSVQRLLIILPLTFLLYIKQIPNKTAYRYLLIILTICCLFHLSFMTYSAFPRYEAYLIGCSVIICSTIFAKYGHRILSPKSLTLSECFIYLLAAFLLIPFLFRSWNGFDRASQAAISIHDQQYEMGLFIHRYYDQDPIAFNDIGAVSYLSHGNNLDLWGLANVDIARSRRQHYNTPNFLDSLSQKANVKIAVVFEFPFRQLLLRWKKVASWNIPYNNAATSDSVSFYAVNPTEAPRLLKNLQDYQKYLPPGVIVSYY